MRFQLEHNKSDFEGFKSSGLSEIKSIRKWNSTLEGFIKSVERSIVEERERAEYCSNPELVSIYEELRIKNYPDYLRMIETQKENIRIGNNRINWIENNIKGYDTVLNEYQFPINIEFNLMPEGYTKQILS